MWVRGKVEEGNLEIAVLTLSEKNIANSSAEIEHDGGQDLAPRRLFSVDHKVLGLRERFDKRCL